MKVVSINTNGIRAAARKGFFDWFDKEQPDVVCIQETKAQEEQLGDDVFFPKNYHRYFVDAEKKGYSGVAIYSKKQPDEIIKGMVSFTNDESWQDFDSEGRWIQAKFGKLDIISLYLPSGSSGDIRQDIKFDFMERFKSVFQNMITSGEEFIICGDWNIAHTKKDIKNWRSNQKNSGFLPEERAWLDWLFDETGFVDTFRLVDDRDEQYTWWSNRGQAWANNTGWRLDYQIATPDIGNKVKEVSIYKDERFSDHAPMTMIYDYEL